MSAAPEEQAMSVEAYLALDDSSVDVRYEYRDGYVVMMTGGSNNHSLISANLIMTLGYALRASSCLVFSPDARVKLSDSRYVYPDVTVRCAPEPPEDLQSVNDPMLVIEVLSPSTAAYDRGQKLQDYRECPSLTTILLVAQERPVVDVYRRQTTDIWTVQTYGYDDQIVLADIHVTLPVAEIYRHITFTHQ